MKKIMIILTMLLATVLLSCNSLQSKKLFTCGTWHVTYLLKNHRHLKDGMSSYIFKFKENDKVVATRGKDVFYGRWAVTSSEPTDDAPRTDIGFTITFAKGSGLTALNSEWRISKEALHTLCLKENSNGGDFLIFEKSE